jgi:hypothetical protein
MDATVKHVSCVVTCYCILLCKALATLKKTHTLLHHDCIEKLTLFTFCWSKLDWPCVLREKTRQQWVPLFHLERMALLFQEVQRRRGLVTLGSWASRGPPYAFKQPKFTCNYYWFCEHIILIPVLKIKSKNKGRHYHKVTSRLFKRFFLI